MMQYTSTSAHSSDLNFHSCPTFDGGAICPFILKNSRPRCSLALVAAFVFTILILLPAAPAAAQEEPARVIGANLQEIIITRTRLLGRYKFGDNVQGWSTGIAISF